MSITINGVPWHEARGGLAGGGPRQRVFALNRTSGTIRFGDGRHGRIPPKRVITCSSPTPRRPGFTEYRDAMKAVDPGIQVCATWADVEFIRLMESRGERYDCLVVHPYANLGRKGEQVSPGQMYRRHRRGTREMTNAVKRLKTALHGIPAQRRPTVAISEYGALGGRVRSRLTRRCGSRWSPGSVRRYGRPRGDRAR